MATFPDIASEVTIDLAVKTRHLVVAVWDRRLHAGAAAEGLALSPAVLEP
ncbi:MAG: hypothetical protein WKF86_06895 [Acidimicrobiales bacterium]